ncbi:hypothetical protein EV44_g3243 [Erysiphe necator]|uniref:Uncharacterized protein n=1 Tax=Uncinula necator TaxID=52586 RepID=A0A0B1NUR5_UNCNE|nr:hypothetical protein EV44_g3243 [Erysiphe necator]
MKERKIAQEWDLDQFFLHLEDLFVYNNAPNRAQAKIYAIHQGPKQLFAKFRSVFEQICSEANFLAPIGPAKVNAIKTALSLHLKRGIAYRKAISYVNYDSFIIEVQDLVAGLEALPKFRSGQGSATEYNIYVNLIVDSSLAPQQVIQSTTQAPEFDLDRDVQMSGVNNLQVHLQAQSQAIIAALRSGNLNSSNNKNRINDTRLNHPPLSQIERNRRIEAKQCERCGKSPSMR